MGRELGGRVERRLASQDPMGTVTSRVQRVPVRVASRGLTLRLACRMPVLTEPLLT